MQLDPKGQKMYYQKHSCQEFKRFILSLCLYSTYPFINQNMLVSLHLRLVLQLNIHRLTSTINVLTKLNVIWTSTAGY